MKKTGKRLAIVGLFCLWSGLEFGVHLACFDVFMDDPWYFYVIALALSFLQLIVLWLFQRIHCYWPLLVCAIIYGMVILLWDGYFLIGKLFSRFYDYPIGLDVLGLACDMIGLITCFICYTEKQRKVKKCTGSDETTCGTNGMDTHERRSLFIDGN